MFRSGGILAKRRGFLDAVAAHSDDLAGSGEGGRDARPRHDSDNTNLPDPYADDPKWPAWKVTVFVILFCGVFWTGVAYLLTRLFG